MQMGPGYSLEKRGKSMELWGVLGAFPSAGGLGPINE